LRAAIKSFAIYTRGDVASGSVRRGRGGGKNNFRVSWGEHEEAKMRRVRIADGGPVRELQERNTAQEHHLIRLIKTVKGWRERGETPSSSGGR